MIMTINSAQFTQCSILLAASKVIALQAVWSWVYTSKADQQQHAVNITDVLFVPVVAQSYNSVVVASVLLCQSVAEES
jgi:hypothetical protein